MLMPDDEVVFFVFTGPSAHAVRVVAARAELPFERIVRSLHTLEPHRKEGVLMRLSAVTAALVAVAIAALAAAGTGAAHPSSPAAPTGSAKAWCASVIATNTRFGTMKNKHYLPNVPITTWKKIVDYTVAHADAYLALAPSELKTAVAHQIAWFKKVQKNYTRVATTLPPLTVADVKLLKSFQQTKCGITFSA